MKTDYELYEQRMLVEMAELEVYAIRFSGGNHGRAAEYIRLAIDELKKENALRRKENPDQFSA